MAKIIYKTLKERVKNCRCLLGVGCSGKRGDTRDSKSFLPEENDYFESWYGWRRQFVTVLSKYFVNCHSVFTSHNPHNSTLFTQSSTVPYHVNLLCLFYKYNNGEMQRKISTTITTLIVCSLFGFSISAYFFYRNCHKWYFTNGDVFAWNTFYFISAFFFSCKLFLFISYLQQFSRHPADVLSVIFYRKPVIFLFKFNLTAVWKWNPVFLSSFFHIGNFKMVGWAPQLLMILGNQLYFLLAPEVLIPTEVWGSDQFIYQGRVKSSFLAIITEEK